MLPDQGHFRSYEEGHRFDIIEIVGRWRNGEQRYADANASRYLWYSNRYVERLMLNDCIHIY